MAGPDGACVRCALCGFERIAARGVRLGLAYRRVSVRQALKRIEIFETPPRDRLRRLRKLLLH